MKWISWMKGWRQVSLFFLTLKENYCMWNAWQKIEFFTYLSRLESELRMFDDICTTYICFCFLVDWIDRGNSDVYVWQIKGKSKRKREEIKI